MTTENIIKLLWPVILLQVCLQVYAIYDIYKKRRTRNLDVTVWTVICVIGGLLGASLYLILGSSDEHA